MHRMLEIGHGFSPITFRLAVNGTNLPDNVYYVGIDHPKYFAWTLAPRIKARVLADLKSLRAGMLSRPNTEVYSMDATRLRFPDCSFDSVHMNNVLNQNALKSMPNEFIESMIAEARRVLVPGGHLVILHDLKDHRTDAQERVAAVGGFTEIRPNDPSLPNWFVETSLPPEFLKTIGVVRPEVERRVFRKVA